MHLQNILITGGGTGGHLSIAKVLANELNKRGITPCFIGSTRGQDQEWFKESPLFEKKYFLKSTSFVNKNPIQKFFFLFSFFSLILQAYAIIKRDKIEKVISVGGFSAAPAAFACVLSGRKLFIHEQNAEIGLLNKILKPFAKIFFSSYDPASPVSDYPIDLKFFEIYRIRTEIRTILFLGGSQGAKGVNDFAMKVAKYLHDNGYKIIHQCGKHDFQRVAEFYNSQRINAECFAFSNEIEKVLQSADFAVSRSGAGSLWELSAAGVPALYVPFPYAAGDHQYKNALFLQERGLCMVSRENALSLELLQEALKCDVKMISSTLKGAISPKGCAKIADFILQT